MAVEKHIAITGVGQFLEQFKINGTTPFHSPGDTVDEALGQAHALLTLLSGAESVCDVVTYEQGDAYESLRNGIQARALDGIGTLVAFAQFNLDVTRENGPTRAAERRQNTKWVELLGAYNATKVAMKEHSSTPGERKFGTEENEAYEARTAELADAQSAAFEALMLEPAPDSEALAYKTAEYAEFIGGECWHRARDVLEQIAADAKRLSV